ncbi:MAG TPA: CheR family methyltransferase [Rhodopila sp.]
MSDQRLSIVGLGASAGGIDAFRNFFQNMPADSGFSFVVLMHLPDDRRSMLPEILQRWTTMPVFEATDGQMIEANRVYVPPPHAIVLLQDGRLNIKRPARDAPRDYRPIDGFFNSLAADLRENAAGVILSGTGSDGALGLKAIKQRGGLTFAQGVDGSAPQHEGMPLGAIATGAVDIVAPVEDIPGHLLRMRRNASANDLDRQPPEETEETRLAICNIVRTRLGHDFSGYKDKTFLRRVQRRMQVVGIDTIQNYAVRLEQDHDEVTALFRDLLIRVTSFFRDNATFDVLEQQVIPRLFDGKHADGAVRVWVPGCATGEEAYSIAILLREQMDRQRASPKVQVFATDIDEPAIGTARLGHYPADFLEGMPAERRQRFFRPTSTGYVVTKDIRELCTFSPHSIIRDPPFSRMDLISCRNLLIYLDAQLQTSVIPIFHYSLVPNGILLLGNSESITRHEKLFEPLDKAARIFRRRDIHSPLLNLRGGQYDFMSVRRDLSSHLKSLSDGPTRTGGPGSAAKWLNNHTNPDRRSDRGRGDQGVIESLRGRLGGSLQRFINRFGGSGPDAEQLYRELTETREQLQSITEEHETALEEVRSANEELHSVNEELQSTNEELETSKEEIQSVNEELHTVNLQLSEKVDELDRANSDLKNLFSSTEIATIFLDRHFIVRSFTPAVAGIYNLIPSDQGRPLTDIVSQLRYDDLRQDVDRVLASLQPLERRVSRKDGKAHFMMRVLPYRAPDSTVSGTLVTFVDVSSIVQAEEHQRLLVDELNHRVKNMLTVVISLAQQTLRRSTSLEAFSDTFMGRVRALTVSYTLLSDQKWLGVPLREVLAEETKPYMAAGQTNIVMGGPDLHLSPTGALSLGMVMHELVTNSMKYGALSVPSGRATISWRLEDDGQASELLLEWIESGGPPVAPPTRRGFGMTLIERSFQHELSGSANIDFDVTGVKAILRAPVALALTNHPSSGEEATP